MSLSCFILNFCIQNRMILMRWYLGSAFFYIRNSGQRVSLIKFPLEHCTRCVDAYWCPSATSSHLRKGAPDLIHCDQYPMGDCDEKLLKLFSLAVLLDPIQSAGCSKCLPFHSDESCCAFGTVNTEEMFLYSSKDLYLDAILFHRFTDNSLDVMACFHSDIHHHSSNLI